MNIYYEKRIGDNSDYEEAYWGTVVDPDGNVRNRIEEEEKFLANVKKEVNFINSLPPSKVLDVGCGLGFLLGAVDDKHQKTGLEVSSFAADYAKKYSTIYNCKLEDADFEANSFDVVIAHHVIEHVDCPEEFVKKIKDILTPNGILILATPDFDSVCAGLFKENYRMLHDKTHVSLFSFKSLKAMLVDLGFEIIDVDFPYFETEYVTDSNIQKMLNHSSGEISPACWGNFMTFYCRVNG